MSLPTNPNRLEAQSSGPLELSDHPALNPRRNLFNAKDGDVRISKVSCLASQVVPKISNNDVGLKSCLKKAHGDIKTSHQLRFSPRKEVRYYLSSPLIRETPLQRLISTIRGKMSARGDNSPSQPRRRGSFRARMSALHP